VATIVILEHRISLGLPYIVYRLAELWRGDGHRVLVHRGAEDPPAGDLAILHVDLSVTPAEYRALVSRYPRVVNGAVLDIRKQTFSQSLVGRESDWDGAVLVKTAANFGGRPENWLFARRRAEGEAGAPAPGPLLTEYPLYASPADVPEDTWTTEGLVVEKFLPEQDERGFYLRIWLFCGDRDHSIRCRSSVPIVKSHNVIERELVPVPDDIHAWRHRLGFDYGKFDYVSRNGRSILLDVNRTPGAPTTVINDPRMRGSFETLARGLQSFLR
jgi:hypothetical protein